MANQHENSEYVVQNAVDHLLAQDAEYTKLRNQIILNNQTGGVDPQTYVDSIKNNNINPDDMNRVGQLLTNGQDESYKKVNKFTKAMYKKYKTRQMNISEVVEHSRRHASKIGLSETEFRMFEVLYQNISDKADGRFPNEERNTQLGKALGSVNPPFVSNKNIKVAAGDKRYVDEILRIASLNRNEHARCVLQTNAYGIHGVHEVFTQAKFIAGHHNRSCAVHPLVVALFGPKIPIIDDRMLNSNLARIIVDRIQGLPIRNRADFEFFVDLTTDQQESVCDSKSIFNDLLKRIEVQEMLRRAVWQMRGSQFYECNTSGLIASLDNCALNPSDSPHLLYVRDEGTMLRRLLHCFSFRPTHVTTRPIFAMTGMVPPVGRLDQLTMINVQIPHQSLDTTAVTEVPLAIGLQAPHWYLENGIVIPKQNSIVYSREVIFFYVNRRYQSVGAMYNAAYQFNKLPVAVSGFNKINHVPVDAKQVMTIHQQAYILRSVVVVEGMKEHNKLYDGCKTIIFKTDDESLKARNVHGWGDDGQGTVGASTQQPLDDFYDQKAEDAGNLELQPNGHIYEYNPYKHITDASKLGTNDAVITTANPIGDAGIKNVKSHGTIFIYSQPMKDTRSDIPHQFLGIDHMPQRFGADK